MTYKPEKSRAELLNEFNALPANARVNEVMVAAVIGCSLSKLQRDRVYGGGIPFIKEGGKLVTDKAGQVKHYGGRVFYLKCHVLDYLEPRNRTVTSTSAISAAA